MNVLTVVRRLFSRFGPLFATLVVAAVMLFVGAAFLDCQVQRAGYELVDELAPKTHVDVEYENIILPERIAARLRYRYALGGPLPFDRPSGMYLTRSIDDTSLVRLADFCRWSGSPRVLQIDAVGDRLTDDGLRRLAAFSELERLRVALSVFPSGCTDSGCSVIAQMPRLRSVALVYLPVGDATVERLARTNPRMLRHIELNHSHVTDVGLTALARLTALRHLEARDCRATREGAWAFRTARPEVIFGGPNVPASVSREEFQSYRRLHERLRREWGGPGPTTRPNDTGR